MNNRKPLWMILGFAIALGLVLVLTQHKGRIAPAGETPAATATPTRLPWTATSTRTDRGTPQPRSTKTPPRITNTEITVVETPMPEGPACQDELQIQATLQAAIPDERYLRGLTYQTNGSYPPSISFLGITSGRTDQLVVGGEETPGAVQLDLAGLYFLGTGGSLESLWLVTGMTTQDGSYTSFLYPPAERQQAQVTFAQPGHVFEVALSDWYVQPERIAWEKCLQAGQYTPPRVCALGWSLDPQGSGQFLSSGVPPEGWLAFGWLLYPSSRVTTLSLPGSCK